MAGSFKVHLGRKMANRSYLFGPSGDIVARYDKMHLFDVDLATGESHRESTEVEGGEKAVIAKTEIAKNRHEHLLRSAFCVSLSRYGEEGRADYNRTIRLHGSNG